VTDDNIDAVLAEIDKMRNDPKIRAALDEIVAAAPPPSDSAIAFLRASGFPALRTKRTER